MRAPAAARFLIALSLVEGMAACSSFTPEERGAREAFEAWRAGSAAGDVEVNFSMLSLANKSEWLLGRLEADDAVIRDRRAQLTGSARTDLDLWLEHSRKFRTPRAEPLPRSLRDHPWLRQVYEDTIVPQLPMVKSYFSRLAPTNFFVDGVGATVAALVDQESIYFGMVVEGGAWKIDGQIRPR